MKKTIILALTASTMLGLGSCKLDLEPKSDLTYKSFGEQEAGVRAGYTGFVARFRDYGNTFFTLGELRADGWINGKSMESPWSLDFMRNQYSATSTHYDGWGGFYSLIHYCNDFLQYAERIKFANEAERHNLIAQAYGMRAYIYYTMLKTWGDVIISDSTVPLEHIKDLQKLRRKRSPKAEVMGRVLTDIEQSLKHYAESGVAETWRNSNVYWSKAATLILKGDALLWKGQVLGGGEADFRAAKEALMSISGLTKQYRLVEYDNLWGQANEGNAEFIFALDYAKDQATHFYAGSFAARGVDLTGKYSQSGEALGDLGFSGGNHQGPSDALLTALYSNSQDKRAQSFALVFDTADAQDLTSLSNSSNEHYKGAILRKFWGRKDSDGTRLRDENIPIYRYADVLLLLAEAKAQLGEDPSQEINQVRTRAGITEEYRSQGKLADKRAILAERFKEFVGEGKRWWDLVRMGDNLVFEYVTTLPQAEPWRIYLPLSTNMLSEDPEYIKQTEGY